MAKHIHASNMALYAKDADNSLTPYEFWECNEGGDWAPLVDHPKWRPEIAYRRKREILGFVEGKPVRRGDALYHDGWDIWVKVRSTGCEGQLIVSTGPGETDVGLDVLDAFAWSSPVVKDVYLWAIQFTVGTWTVLQDFYQNEEQVIWSLEGKQYFGLRRLNWSRMELL